MKEQIENAKQSLPSLKIVVIDTLQKIHESTELSGYIDGSFVLVESKRGSRKDKLHYIGGDIENLELNIVFENHHWVVTDEVKSHKHDIFPFIIHDIMLDVSFRGSAMELYKLLYRRFGQQYYFN
ncbi:MAG: hypothetical protein K2H19_03925 [Ruminococcus sp.]|nr:hypothetical protein [Ruminococcus sp.]